MYYQAESLLKKATSNPFSTCPTQDKNKFAENTKIFVWGVGA
jgi:hypothetical protein